MTKSCSHAAVKKDELPEGKNAAYILYTQGFQTCKVHIYITLYKNIQNLKYSMSPAAGDDGDIPHTIIIYMTNVQEIFHIKIEF